MSESALAHAQAGDQSALLPDPRLTRRCRGCGAGDPAGGLAGAGPVRRAGISARLAVPDRDQPEPERLRASSQAPANLFFHDQAMAVALFEQRLVRCGFPAGHGEAVATALFRAVRDGGSFDIRQLLDRVVRA